jgi:N-acetylneuraminate synthase
MNKDAVYIIAEAGVNHNGSLKMAMQLVDAAALAGADAVKFQTFIAGDLVSTYAPKADYQIQNTDTAESQLEMLQKLELSHAMHVELVAYCTQKNIHFLSTPFDLLSADFLINTLDLPRIKISSGELTTAPLLLKIAISGKPVILSTGMATLEDIKLALGVLAFGYLNNGLKPSIREFAKTFESIQGKNILKEKVILLHCTTEYPAPLANIHLNAMDTLRQVFGLPVGYSDHSLGILVPMAAVARGALVIEKHFTLDKTLPGPDHKASLDPQELSEMVSSIRQIELALGSFDKKPNLEELKISLVARKSLVALTDIKVGEEYSALNLGMKRPGTGISSIYFWEYLGKPATSNFSVGELIHE